MEFNTKLSKLIARRKVIETRKRLNKIVQSPFEINNTLKTVYQNNVVDKTKVPISSIKSVLYSLKKKGFISNYKDKHNNIIQGCYIIK